MVNKYDHFHMPTETLVRAIQEIAMRIDDPKQRKKFSNDTIISWKHDLFEMRNCVIERLKKLNRKDPKFFPIQSLVGYSIRAGYEEEGRVVHRDATHVFIRVPDGKGEPIVIKVLPETLRLKYIK